LKRLRCEWRAGWTAVMFLTRLPVPTWADHDAVWLQRAARWFPWVGLLVGGLGAAVYWLAAMVWPGSIALLLSLAATVLATGAFHEDGFADVCDGFGGGYTQPQVLTIMQDSRVGAFGAIGIALMLGLKVVTLLALPAAWLPAVLIAGHALSRATATSLLATLAYVRVEGPAKAKPLAHHRLRGLALAWALGGGLAGLAILPGGLVSGRAALVLAAAGLARLLCARWFVRRIGGYTGDCLGATQQVAELSIYLAVAATLTWN
jgi:adenosylcobinamide-GDP ribazoletransferase